MELHPRPSEVNTPGRNALPIHPAAELFPRMRGGELRALSEDIKKNGLTSPIVLWRADSKSSPYLIDGRNPLDGIVATGRQVRVEFVGATKTGEQWALRVDDKRISGSMIVLPPSVYPYAYVISANIHRRHLNAEEKRETIAKLVKAKPQSSNNAIANQVRVDDKTVAKVRREMEARSEIPNASTRTDSKGRQQPAKKATSKRGAVKFTSERTQQIRNPVERGMAREQIAEIIGVTVGSLQVTCSRLGISLRKPLLETVPSNDAASRNDIGPDSTGEVERICARSNKQLEAENARLRPENARLRRENDALRHEVEELEAKLQDIPAFLDRTREAAS